MIDIRHVIMFVMGLCLIVLVYNLEMYYGDETLEHLVEHSRSFNEQLSTFEFIYSLTEEEFLEDEEAEEGTEEIERDEAQQAQN